MFNNFKKSKIKNVKIQNWRLELLEYRFDVEYRPRRLNSAADALTRNPKTKKICCQQGWKNAGARGYAPRKLLKFAERIASPK